MQFDPGLCDWHLVLPASDDTHRCSTRPIPDVKRAAVVIVIDGNCRPLRITPAFQFAEAAGAGKGPITANGLGLALASRLILINCVLLLHVLTEVMEAAGQCKARNCDNQESFHACAPILD